MNEKAGKLGSGFAWLFALGAVGVGIGGAYATAGLGAKVSSAVFFGVFAVCGFSASFFTRAGKAAATMAFIVAALAVSGTYYAIVNAAVGTDAGALGAAMGVFVATIALLTSLSAGVGGVIVGARAKAKLASEGGTVKIDDGSAWQPRAK